MDDDGFEDWYRAEHRRLVNALAVAVSDVESATDAADEAFARCLERWNGPHRPSDPTAWTYRVAINLLRRRWRRRQRGNDLLALDPAQAVVSLPEPAIELWRAVAGLPERARLAVVLRYIGGLTEPEVAAAMGVARGTVSATLSKARSQLSAALLIDREVTDV